MMDLELANQNISDLCDWIEEQQALSKVFHDYPMDEIGQDLEDNYDTLVQNGMFRNRDPPHLAKPISGSNQDTADNPDELAEYNQGIADWIEQDQMETLREAFPEEYP